MLHAVQRTETQARFNLNETIVACTVRCVFDSFLLTLVFFAIHAHCVFSLNSELIRFR